MGQLTRAEQEIATAYDNGYKAGVAWDMDWRKAAEKRFAEADAQLLALRASLAEAKRDQDAVLELLCDFVGDTVRITGRTDDSYGGTILSFNTSLYEHTFKAAQKATEEYIARCDALAAAGNGGKGGGT